MKMQKIWALMLALMLFMMPGLALAEDVSVGIIGGADGPTAIIVAEPAEETADAEAAPEKEAPLTMMESLGYMAKGLVGIFVVTGMIILVLVVLEKATKGKKNTEE